MAKGNFLTSTVRGKLGEMVGYKNTNSNDKVKQAWRSYVPHISNPKTEGQARQRMIVSNLTQNYTALKAIIARGFEGIKYGGKSYQKFLSLNMKRAGQGPFIPKGTRSTPLPIQGMNLSQGSLISIAVDGTRVAGDGANRRTALVTDLFGSSASAPGTYGVFCQRIIDANTDVRDGDQITFVSVCETENLEYVYRFASIVIDSTSTEAMTPGDIPYMRIPGTAVYAVMATISGQIRLCYTVEPDLNEIPVAGAVIQSRQGGDGNWLRSPSVMWIDPGNTEIMQYYSSEMYQLALESYMASKSVSVDWPTEPDADITDVWSKSLVNAEILVDETTHSVVVAGLINSDFTNIKYIVKTVDNVQYLTKSDGSIFQYGGTNIPASSLTGTSATRELVNINGLAEYNISNVRSAEPEKPDTKKKAK